MKQPTLNEVALIYENKENISVLKTDISYIKESIHTIESNHLTHIQDDISEIKEAIAGLRMADSKTKPVVNLVIDIVKYVLFAVIGAGMALIIGQKV